MSSTSPTAFAVQIDDRHAKRLDGRFAVAVNGIDEGAGLHARARDPSGSEELELQAVQQHPPAEALAIVAVGAAAHGDNRDFRMIDEILADAGLIDPTIYIVRLEVVGGPIPESIRSFGVMSEPAARMTSPSAATERSAPLASR